MEFFWLFVAKNGTAAIERLILMCASEKAEHPGCDPPEIHHAGIGLESDSLSNTFSRRSQELPMQIEEVEIKVYPPVVR